MASGAEAQDPHHNNEESVDTERKEGTVAFPSDSLNPSPFFCLAVRDTASLQTVYTAQLATLEEKTYDTLSLGSDLVNMLNTSRLALGEFVRKNRKEIPPADFWTLFAIILAASVQACYWKFILPGDTLIKFFGTFENLNMEPHVVTIHECQLIGSMPLPEPLEEPWIADTILGNAAVGRLLGFVVSRHIQYTSDEPCNRYL
ncbi:hypothetical protein FE257_003793 [Aspergillus nanangensis]|uniref:Uncharacterized protein n=1 Tax=Aspergillus nanangensis TaxID=2582783 RepID=A0AAD4GPF2_ASPNN|nr:hypothetical protein FE257_003793 [Aspergillus nanangensis]